MKNKCIEDEINLFLQKFGIEELTEFFDDVLPLVDLYNIDESEDWLNDVVNSEDVLNVRLIRTVYLISKFSEKHAASLCYLKATFKDLFKRMEKVPKNSIDLF